MSVLGLILGYHPKRSMKSSSSCSKIEFFWVCLARSSLIILWKREGIIRKTIICKREKKSQGPGINSRILSFYSKHSMWGFRFQNLPTITVRRLQEQTGNRNLRSGCHNADSIHHFPHTHSYLSETPSCSSCIGKPSLSSSLTYAFAFLRGIQSNQTTVCSMVHEWRLVH